MNSPISTQALHLWPGMNCRPRAEQSKTIKRVNITTEELSDALAARQKDPTVVLLTYLTHRGPLLRVIELMTRLDIF